MNYIVAILLFGRRGLSSQIFLYFFLLDVIRLMKLLIRRLKHIAENVSVIIIVIFCCDYSWQTALATLLNLSRFKLLMRKVQSAYSRSHSKFTAWCAHCSKKRNNFSGFPKRFDSLYSSPGVSPDIYRT